MGRFQYDIGVNDEVWKNLFESNSVPQKIKDQAKGYIDKWNSSTADERELDFENTMERLRGDINE